MNTRVLKYFSILVLAFCLCVSVSLAQQSGSNRLTQLPPQGPGWVAPMTAAERLQQQRFLSESYGRQLAQQESVEIRKQDEILKIYAKDPWRRINDTTNYVGDQGWVQFQGKFQTKFREGLLFQGSYGRVLSISTKYDSDPTYKSQSEHVYLNESQNPYNNRTRTQSSYSTKKSREKLYGEDYFMLVNFPFPALQGNGFENLMAFDCGYITFTNSDGMPLTVRKLDYGIPCIKNWSKEEIDAAYQRAAQERAEAEQRAARERAEVEAERAAKQAAIEAEKQAKKEKTFKQYQDKAEKGDPIALNRLAEFYRDGYGVPKDLEKSEDYFKKAKEAEKQEAERLKQEQAAQEKAEQKQKFNWFVAQAEKGGVSGMIGAGKCYRDGLGVEKDLEKARYWFDKASIMGSEEASKLKLELQK